MTSPETIGSNPLDQLGELTVKRRKGRRPSLRVALEPERREELRRLVQPSGGWSVLGRLRSLLRRLFG